MIFLRILLLALLVLFSFIFGLLMCLWYVGRMAIVPLCMILFGSVSGKAADEFCHQCCETERGEKIARLFYMFYNAGYNGTKDEEFQHYFDFSINSKPEVERIIRLIDRSLLTRNDARYTDNGQAD